MQNLQFDRMITPYLEITDFILFVIYFIHILSLFEMHNQLALVAFFFFF